MPLESDGAPMPPVSWVWNGTRMVPRLIINKAPNAPPPQEGVGGIAPGKLKDGTADPNDWIPAAKLADGTDDPGDWIPAAKLTGGTDDPGDWVPAAKLACTAGSARISKTLLSIPVALTLECVSRAIGSPLGL